MPDVPAKPRRAHRMPVGKLRRGMVGEANVDSAAPPAAEVPEVVTAEVDPTATESVDLTPATETIEDEADTTSADTADEGASDEAPDDPETLTPLVFEQRKPVGKRLKIAVAASAAIFVAAAGFAGATVQPYLADRAVVTVKHEVASTAASAITTLWTYTPDDMEALPDRASQFLSGGFEDAYRQYVDGIAATNKQAQVSNDTQVLGAAVESIGPSEASAIIYTNSTATSPLTKGIPSLRYVSYRLTMERHEAKWLVTKMSTITSLDLTPQL